MTVLYVLIAILALIVIITAVELFRLLRIRTLPDLPDKADAARYSLSINGKSFEELYLFLAGKQTEPCFSQDEIFSLLSNQAEYMNKRFDCADFRAQMLFKIYKDCPLNEKCANLIKNTFLGFKYFINDPGDE